MSKHLTSADISAMPVNERLELIAELWDSLEGNVAEPPLPDEHRAELERRLADHARNPSATEPWDKVKLEILRELKQG